MLLRLSDIVLKSMSALDCKAGVNKMSELMSLAILQGLLRIKSSICTHAETQSFVSIRIDETTLFYFTSFESAFLMHLAESLFGNAGDLAGAVGGFMTPDVVSLIIDCSDLGDISDIAKSSNVTSVPGLETEEPSSFTTFRSMPWLSQLWH